MLTVDDLLCESAVSLVGASEEHHRKCAAFIEQSGITAASERVRALKLSPQVFLAVYTAWLGAHPEGSLEECINDLERAYLHQTQITALAN